MAVLTRSTVLESVVPVESTAKDHVNDATGKVGEEVLDQDHSLPRQIWQEKLIKGFCLLFSL